jgi:DNA-binding HxlR family transcriptional regulator
MSRCPDIPIHTENVMFSLSKAPASFNNLQATLGLSPSTLSRILRFLRKGRLIEVSIYNRRAEPARPGKDADGRTGPRKLYILTKRGKRSVPYFKRMDSDKRQILKLIRKR